jgi:hypothetical protein
MSDMRFCNSFKTKIMDLLPVELNKIRRTAAITFAGKDDFGFLAEWRGKLGDDQNPYRRDAVDFAELTIHRFVAHSAIRSRLFSFHCLHHGCAVVLDRKEVVLGSSERGDYRSASMIFLSSRLRLERPPHQYFSTQWRNR